MVVGPASFTRPLANVFAAVMHLLMVFKILLKGPLGLMRRREHKVQILDFGDGGSRQAAPLFSFTLGSKLRGSFRFSYCGFRNRHFYG